MKRPWLKKIPPLGNRRGMVFLSALCIMVILMVLGAAYMSVVRSGLMMSRNEIEILKATYFAEAAVEHSIAEILYGTDQTGDGGVGDIGFGDIDGDFRIDYYSSYDEPSDPKKLFAGGVSGKATRVFEVQLNDSGIASAVVCGRGMVMGGTMTGVINGNVDGTDEYGQISLPAGLTAIGTVTTNDKWTFFNTIPRADFDEYRTLATNLDPAKVYTGGITYSGAVPAFGATGMYFVDGNFTIDIPDITLDGTLIVNGSVTIQSNADNLRITPVGNHPAIVAQGIYWTDVDGSSLDNVTLGMVYVDQIFNMQECSHLTINGALVARAHNIELNNITDMTVNYDPLLTLESPYFYGGTFGTPKIVLWQGHED